MHLENTTFFEDFENVLFIDKLVEGLNIIFNIISSAKMNQHTKCHQS